MKETLEVINRMQADGVVGKYAIGGAVGATFYLEPIATVDLDIFLEFPISTGSPLVSVTPIYDYLTQHGGVVLHEYIVIGKWPVQFLPVSNALQREALEQARQIDIDGTPTRVLLAEHLVAIALSTGRAKDFSRIVQFLSERVVDQTKMKEVIARHELIEKWNAFEKRFLHE